MSSISLLCRSQTTISRTFNKTYSEKFRYIGLKRKYIRQLTYDEIIIIVYLNSCNNVTNPFFKGLLKDLIKDVYDNMGLRPL